MTHLISAVAVLLASSSVYASSFLECVSLKTYHRVKVRVGALPKTNGNRAILGPVYIRRDGSPLKAVITAPATVKAYSWAVGPQDYWPKGLELRVPGRLLIQAYQREYYEDGDALSGKMILKSESGKLIVDESVSCYVK